MSKYVLCSFFYLKNIEKRPELLKLILERNESGDFLLDSGAFTLFSSKSKSIDFETYLDSYIAFINKHDIKYFIELDIDSVVGYEKVLDYRERLEKETGKKCVPVWHKSRGIEAYKEIVSHYDYICIGGLGNREIKQSEYDKVKNMVKYANQRDTKVHGLAFTRQDAYQYGFYSVDSSTWTGGERFGKRAIFDGEKMISKEKPKSKRGIRKNLHTNNLKEWIRYQHFIDAKGRNT
ncbi:hypothetical protein IW492_02760 [Enterococcus sp. BWB1-3]|uniref:hypothetical protein n=1 Tax=Enterococcus sp. BWB1-3 TaxID=2787713 RepID=UPI0019203CF5|nr:hypothetical protein [Enterococcus sp. BWB1-3]MBL1228152.1 hypothetical protein [Enterococcus sp. BWB1-3]